MALGTVADDLVAAMSARRRQFVDRTFKAVERVGAIRECYLKRARIVVPAHIAFRHLVHLRLRRRHPMQLSVLIALFLLFFVSPLPAQDAQLATLTDSVFARWNSK